MLLQLQQYLRTSASRGRTTQRVGPFLVTIQEDTTHPFLNYAIPDDDARPAPGEVAALEAAFAARGRIARLEFLERAAPAALEALLAAGFALEARLRAMIATSAANVPVPDGYAIAPPCDDAERAAVHAVQNAAFGDPGPASPEAVARSRELVEAGGIALAVWHLEDGEVVAGGVATPPQGSGFTEIGGIAVAEAHRRRGLASVLTAELTRRALASGVRTAFLTPGDDGAAEAYARAGFADAGRMLHVRKEG